MSLTEIRAPCYLTKYNTENMPSPSLKREDRFPSRASSFEEISEAEEEYEVPSTSCRCSIRSPYAENDHARVVRRKSEEIVSQLTFTKRSNRAQLSRQYSDPQTRKRSSVECYCEDLSPLRKLSDSWNSLISLPPIPESANPTSSKRNEETIDSIQEED